MMAVCSPEQMMPLSKRRPSMIMGTHFSRSASSSIKHCTLPAPTPKAGLPEAYAVRTMPMPPVEMHTSHCFITWPEMSTVGSSTIWMMSWGT